MYAGSKKTGALMLGVFLIFTFITVTGLGSVPFFFWLIAWLLSMGHAAVSAWAQNHEELP
jgi:hypothetical protein